jgi:osmoprotectant transport system ATP-binding protein
MDEPFGAIDAINRTRLQDELLQIQTRLQKTILFVTHDVEEAFKLGECIVVMREGRVVQEGTPLDLVTAPADDFVRELIGAGDMLRRLSLLPVAAVPLRPPDGTMERPRIGQKDDLRRALGLLLASEERSLAVVDDDGNPVGLLDFAAIRSALAPAADGKGG